jgi:hypothetical protein
LLWLDSMAHETSTAGLAHEAPHDVERDEHAEPEERDIEGGEGSGPGGEPGTEDGLLEAVRVGLEEHAGGAGPWAAEGRVRDDVLLRRLRDFICGASVKEGWRG